MKSIRNIGVFLPTPLASDPATRRAEQLARHTRATITLLVPHDHVDRIEVARLAASLEGTATLCLLPSESADAIREVARERSLDILLKTARPQRGSGKVVGGIARALLRDAPCPLWIVRQSSRRHDAPVIAAVGDLSMANEDTPTLEARRVIETASHIATYESRQLVIAHAWSPLERALGQLVPSERRLYLFEHRVWMREKLARLAAALTTLPVDLEILEGDPSVALPQLAEKLASETIVVGHNGRRGLGAFFFGNTGEFLIEDTRANVLSVRAA